MRNTILCLLVCIFCTVLSSAQSKCDCFDRLYHLSDYYDAIGNESMSISSLKDAISFLDSEIRPQFFDLVGSSYAYYRRFDSAKKYYTSAIIDGGYDIEIIKGKYPYVLEILDSINIKKAINKNKERIDLGLNSKFVAALAVDQSIRNGTIFEEALFNDTLPCNRRMIESICERVDSVTFEFVKWVLNTYGFPSFNKFGFVPDGFVAMILHSTAYTNEAWNSYIFSKLEELNSTCDYSYKSQILFIKERQKLFNNLKTQVGGIGTRNRYANIDDISKSDSIRFEYNMLRIKEEITEFKGNRLPEGYKPIAYPKNYFCLKKYHID